MSMFWRRVAEWWGAVAGGRRSVKHPALLLMWLLTLVSLPYSIAVFVVLRLRAMHPAGVDVPVISVGNMVVGGTGKTPIVIYLARRLVKAGHSVAIALQDDQKERHIKEVIRINAQDRRGL